MRILILKCCLWACFLCCPAFATAQIVDTRPYVDTLSMSERISLRTNTMDWLLLIPNIGVEYDIKNLNWNRWSVGLNLRWLPQSSHTYIARAVYTVAEARLELRNYYRIRPYDNRNVVRQEGFFNRLMSARRKESRHPATVYYRGAYVSYGDFSLRLRGEGRQGSAITGGAMWGMIKPLYEFPNGNSLDMEFGIAAGISYLKYDTYIPDAVNDCYRVTGNKSTIMPMVSDLRLGFVYRFGKYPVNKKYRWRYDVDMTYQGELDSITSQRATDRINNKQMDSLDAKARKIFWETYNAIAPANKAKNDSIRAAESSLRKTLGEEAKEAKKAEKAVKNEKKKKQKNTPTEDQPATPEADNGKEAKEEEL